MCAWVGVAEHRAAQAEHLLGDVIEIVHHRHALTMQRASKIAAQSQRVGRTALTHCKWTEVLRVYTVAAEPRIVDQCAAGIVLECAAQAGPAAARGHYRE